MKNARRNQDPSVERLRWMLIAAITGAAAAAPACAGKSQSTGTAGEAGDGSGGTSTTGGAGGKGAGGSSSGGKGGGAGGTVSSGGAGTGGVGGVITPAGGVGGVGGSTGGAGGSMGGKAGGGAGGSAGQPVEGCAAATSYSPTLEGCEGGFVHRPVPGVCPVPPDDGIGAGGQPPAAGCTFDADCQDGSNGRCVVDNPLPEVATAIYCIYSCQTDDDCSDGQVCSCEGTFVSNGTGEPITLGVCRPGTCGSDGECAAGSLCIAPVYSFCGVQRPSQYHCQTPEDECAGAADCDGFSYCEYQQDHFACLGQPACGRPFLIDGEERRAPLGRGLDWADELPEIGGIGALTSDQRAAVARHFADAALMEHASIAAFARFSLQLLALGAPSDLVMETARAMADETRHARLCFGLAERYGLRSVAPGKLDVTGALGEVDLLDVVEMVTLEGCIGESTAALEAAWAADSALDPVVKEALAGIAEDEARHAALAFRFVAWAAARDARVLPRVRALVARAAAEISGTEERAAGSALEAHGVLDLRTRQAARAAALGDVISAALAGIEGCGALEIVSSAWASASGGRPATD
jgi:hypothetical protein